MDCNPAYLSCLRSLQFAFLSTGFRLAVGGGFAIDGFLGRFTREHDDLDLDVVGELPVESGYALVRKIVTGLYPGAVEAHSKLKITESGMVIEIEYVRHRGSNYFFAGGVEFSWDSPLYLQNLGRLDSLVFDVENPHMIVAIKLLNFVFGKKRIRSKDVADIQAVLPRLDQSTLASAMRAELDYQKVTLN